MAGTIMKGGDHVRITEPDGVVMEGSYVCTLVDGAAKPMVMIITDRDKNTSYQVTAISVRPEDEWEVLPS